MKRSLCVGSIDHLVHDHIFEQITRLLDQFRIENMSAQVIATAPLGFHALQKIPFHPHADTSLIGLVVVIDVAQ